MPNWSSEMPSDTEARIWVTWTSNGHDPYTNPKATTAHAADTMIRTSEDASQGGFPLACGRWAPDGFDAEIRTSNSSRHCKRCQAAIAKAGE